MKFVLLGSLLNAALSSGFLHNYNINAGGCRPRGFTAPPQEILSDVRTATINISGTPFAPLYVRNGSYAFFTVDSRPSFVGLLDTRDFVPKVISRFENPQVTEGLVASKDEKYLFVASTTGATVFDIDKAINGSTGIMVSNIKENCTSFGPFPPALQVELTLDQKFLALANEHGGQSSFPQLGMVQVGNVEIIQLNTVNGSVRGSPIGVLNFGYDVSGLSISPAGDVFYVTSEAADPSGVLPGYHSVVGVRQLEQNPGYGNSTVILSSVFGGCTAVRTLPNADGSIIWSTARGSNLLLAYDAKKMISCPEDALIAAVEVGTAPVSMALIKNETRILVADSNRFYQPGATSGISVIDVQAALQHRPANLGSIPTGLFPREFSVSPDGRNVLVTCHDSSQLQVIDVATVP